MSMARDRDARLFARGVEHGAARLAHLESACRGVQFVGEADGAVLALVEALWAARDQIDAVGQVGIANAMIRAALARVRLDGDKDAR